MTDNQLSVWFQDRPMWLQIAIKRLLERNDFSTKDVDEFVNLCIEEAAGSINDEPFHFPDNTIEQKTFVSLRLISIGDIENINALAPKRPLSFGSGNISIVYGDNGSGKSGYVRILKHLCGALHVDEIRGNVYENVASKKECVITYEKSGIEIPIKWTPQSAAVEELTCIDIFDASCGHIYVTGDNEITYEPPILKFFSSLISCCEKVAKSLQDKLEKLPSQKPDIPKEFIKTQSGHWYSSIHKDCKKEEIENHTQWSESQENELSELDKRLSEKSPSDKTKELRKQQKHSDELLETIIKLSEAFSDTNSKKILDLKKQAILKEKSAKIAAEGAFNTAPLNGVGSDVWKELWNHARQYSQEIPYKSKPFPNTEEAARCPLCQQLLSDEAKSRLLSFEEFVKGKTQKEAHAANKKFEEAINNIGDIPSIETIKTKADAAGISQEDNQSIGDFYTVLRKRKEELHILESAEKMTPHPSIQEAVGRITSLSKSFEESAHRYEDVAKKDNRSQLITKQFELRAKKWISVQNKAIDNEILRLKQVARLEKAKRLTHTKALSVKKGSLAETLITEAFIERFKKELTKLGAARIKVELCKKEVKKGRVLHHLRLRGANVTNPCEILSEGENRIVALVAFLADVGEKQNVAPFVFDDPISSLDQIFEEAVVQRLVELSRERQVIVFTHRLSLLGLLQEKADPNIICVRQEAWGTGEPGTTSLTVKRPDKALNTLLNEKLPRASNLLERVGKYEYENEAKSICSEFRILIERIIECDLLSDVVQRYRRTVITKKKIGNLARIKNDDCIFFENMMAKYSRYEHSQPAEAPVSLPDPDELRQDLVALLSWREEFNKRNL